jgi:general secretion pathway protein D
LVSIAIGRQKRRLDKITLNSANLFDMSISAIPFSQTQPSGIPETINAMALGKAARIAVLASVLNLAACANLPNAERESEAKAQDGVTNLSPRARASEPKLGGNLRVDDRLASAASPSRPEGSVGSMELQEQEGPASANSKKELFVLGSGQLFRGAPSVGSDAKSDNRSISLNFENGDIREIARNILGDLLGENYMIDPRVTGTVSIRTPKGVSRSELMPLFETLLRQVNASLVRQGSVWRVVPSSEAVPGILRPRVGFSQDDGSAVQIYTARHIGAKELQRVMLPFAKGGEAAVRVDELRNLLYLSGTELEIKRLLEIASMFDIDLLAGMSFLLYTLQSTDVKSVMADWERIFQASGNPLAGLLRVIPVERMNALLLISPQSETIAQARDWIEKLDRGSDAGGGARLYVYYLKYSYADKLQPLLQQALGGRPGSASGATVAPGQTSSNLTAPFSPVAGQPITTPGNTGAPPSTSGTPQRSEQQQVARQTGGAGAATAPGANAPIGLARNATVVADKDRNALLIVATPAEYSAIESVLKKLDTRPKQVAIEVQLAEVSLTGDFQFGLQTFFEGKITDPRNRLNSSLGQGSVAIPSNGTTSVFTYTWKKTDTIKALLSLSESKNQVRTLAQPTLITLDNQKASFNSGKQISVRTQTQNSSGTTGSVDSFQYINTGISVNVTPRVSGETVILEIQQEISDAAASTGPNPDISKSSTSTTVMVQSGDTMLIGGLFNNKATNASGGLPFFSSIPVVGGLFGNQRWNSDRSEIALLITPRILGTLEETRDVIDELRAKLVAIETQLPAAGMKLNPTSAGAREKSK